MRRKVEGVHSAGGGEKRLREDVVGGGGARGEKQGRVKEEEKEGEVTV